VLPKRFARAISPEDGLVTRASEYLLLQSPLVVLTNWSIVILISTVNETSSAQHSQALPPIAWSMDLDLAPVLEAEITTAETVAAELAAKAAAAWKNWLGQAWSRQQESPYMTRFAQSPEAADLAARRPTAMTVVALVTGMTRKRSAAAASRRMPARASQHLDWAKQRISSTEKINTGQQPLTRRAIIIGPVAVVHRHHTEEEVGIRTPEM
jgi:hypothetical protein